MPGTPGPGDELLSTSFLDHSQFSPIALQIAGVITPFYRGATKASGVTATDTKIVLPKMAFQMQSLTPSLTLTSVGF